MDSRNVPACRLEEDGASDLLALTESVFSGSEISSDYAAARDDFLMSIGQKCPDNDLNLARSEAVKRLFNPAQSSSRWMLWKTATARKGTPGKEEQTLGVTTSLYPAEGRVH